MNNKHSIFIFIFNLLQDVNILRPLIYLAANKLVITTQLIITEGFIKRDINKNWQHELSQIINETNAMRFDIKNDYEVYKILEGKSGVLVTASESDLSAHAPTHNLLSMAPSSFVKVTLQHGYECVGFLQSEQHDIAHGTNICFAADIVCGWFDEKKMQSMVDSQKTKLLVTGPTSLLQVPEAESKKHHGLVCENLHSVRLSASGDLKANFMDMFNQFCNILNKQKQNVVLRPHPSGQYVLKNNVPLPDNVQLNNNPIYKVDLSQYTYGVSAPSSIIIDMVLADIPVAVWQDDMGIMDTDNYFGLATVSSVKELVEFSEQATLNPERFLERQRTFIQRIGIVTDPQITYQQFSALFGAAPTKYKELYKDKQLEIRERVMYVANDFIPTLQLSFIKPLAEMEYEGEIISELLTESELEKHFPMHTSSASACQYIENKLTKLNPSIIVFCRYSGPNAVFVRLWAKQNNIPVIFHIDDDLLSIPSNIGMSKFNHHNSESRTSTIRYLLDNVDLVYCSTDNLSKRLVKLNIKAKMVVGDIYCSSSIINTSINEPVTVIGYMASADHAHNLDMILPAIVDILKKHSNVIFELFGSIKKPQALEQFGRRIVIAPPISNYNEFLVEFSKRKWDIGLCPLVPIGFNKMKADTKWVEYTAAGVAVIASKGTAYDKCITDVCGILADKL